MAEGYRSAMIASLRGDAPQGPRMGSGVSPLVFDWMRGGNVPLDFQARRAALLRPQRFELPLPLAPTPPSGGGANEPEIPDTTMPPVDVPPSTERDRQERQKPSTGEVPPPPPPPEPPPVVPEPTPDEPEGVIIIEPVIPGEDIFVDDPIPPPPPPPVPQPEPEPEPEPEGVIVIEPVVPGDDIFVEEPIPPASPPAPPPEPEGVITIEPVLPEEDIFVEEPPPPPEPEPSPPEPEPEGVITIEPVEPGDDIFVDVPVPEPEPDLPPASEPEQDFEIVIEGPIEEPVIEEPNLVVPGPVDFQPPDPILEEFLGDWTEPVGEVTVEELDGTDVPGASNPLRDYGDDLGTTVIEGAFDPTLGGTYDPGSEIISPIDGPNDVYANPYIGLNAGGSAGFGDTGFVSGPDLSSVGGNVAMPSDVATITQPTTQLALRDQIDQALAAQEAQAAEAARVAEEAQRAEQARLAEEARKAEEARLAEEARRAREAAARAEAERQAQLEEQRQAELAQQEAARRAAEQQAAEQAALEAELAMLAQLNAQTRAAEERQVMRPVKGNRRMLA